MEWIFWILCFIVVYSYLLYGLIIAFFAYFKKLFNKNALDELCCNLPEVTLFIPAYNEANYVQQKVTDCLALNYPKNKLKFIWVTDGSDDGTPDLLKKFPFIKAYHLEQRSGKIHAMNRGMQFVDTEIVVFSDANTLLGKDSILKIVECFFDAKVGCVAGEKRIVNKSLDIAVNAGEGFYWKYESWVKKQESDFNSVIGAAGELFAIRTSLYQPVEMDSVLDDFMISMRIAMRGYKIKYEPQAYAIETASASITEEMKRKVRIAAGGIQSVFRLLPLLNIFRFGVLSIQYISHKVLRWLVVPISFVFIFILGMLLFLKYPIFHYYGYLFYLQLLFYILVYFGWKFQNRKIGLKALFVPYYVFIMNYSVLLGIRRYISGSYSVNWERAKRG